MYADKMRTLSKEEEEEDERVPFFGAKMKMDAKSVRQQAWQQRAKMRQNIRLPSPLLQKRGTKGDISRKNKSTSCLLSSQALAPPRHT